MMKHFIPQKEHHARKGMDEWRSWRDSAKTRLRSILSREDGGTTSVRAWGSIIIFTACFVIQFITPGHAQENPPYTITIDSQEVHYDYYVPDGDYGRSLPVLICVGGLPIIDGQYVHSHTGECSTAPWIEFAKRQGVAIVGVGFLFVEEDWPSHKSFQYPAVWSGRALLEILGQLSQDHAIDSKKLYLFGISAGAQFAVRFAQWNPEITKGVAAHAAGGYDFPEKYMTPKFLVTVGALDNEGITRVEWAEAFAAVANREGIDVRLEILKDIGHWQTEEQNEMSRAFFKEILEGN